MAKLKDLSVGDLVVINHPNSRFYKRQGEVLWLLDAGHDYLNPNNKSPRPVVEVRVDNQVEWVNPKNLELLFRR